MRYGRGQNEGVGPICGQNEGRVMGVETALCLFSAMRAGEMLGTLSYTRDMRAGYEIAVCMRRIGYRLTASPGDTELCVNAPTRLCSMELNTSPLWVRGCHE
jgi:hypothetical protein